MKINKERFSKIKPKKSKKGVSIVVEYVLLITLSIVMGIIVYKLLRTFIPHEELNCPAETSLLIESYTYDCSSNILTLNIVNNGKFDIGGYFIYATDSPDKELATIDLSKYNNDITSKLNPLGIKFGSLLDKNSLEANMGETDFYNLTSIGGNIYSVEIVPIRWETQNRKMKVISCKDERKRTPVECS